MDVSALDVDDIDAPTFCKGNAGYNNGRKARWASRNLQLWL